MANIPQTTSGLYIPEKGTQEWHQYLNANFKKIDDLLGEIGIDAATIATIGAALANKVDKVSGRGLSSNDYTTTEKNKLAGIAAAAQVNVIESISFNGVVAAITTKKAVITGGTARIDYNSGVAKAFDVTHTITADGFMLVYGLSGTTGSYTEGAITITINGNANALPSTYLFNVSAGQGRDGCISWIPLSTGDTIILGTSGVTADTAAKFYTYKS